ncbi:hypothetical protein JNX00_16060 [Hydrogenophaga sp. YM1]|nr:hypothetical protein [Hydrogenophaga sp. YM1]QRR33156.1 hypothetical protein JNX00_16060 [Hydrogenophaga sp. YM1]
MRPLIHLLLASLVAGCASRSYTEAEFKRPAHAECIAGDCRNGIGTLRYLDGTEITGARAHGEQMAGTYQIRWPCQPDRTHALTYDAQKRPVSGTIIRTCMKDSLAMSQAPRVASFSGTFFAVSNPFTRETVSSYKSGTYTDTRGILWEGEFDYIPIRDSVELPGYGKTFLRSGAFVFVGARIDTELDEVVRGLFISEPTRPEADIRLIRARPDYLESLRSTFVADRAANAAELAEERRASREAFNTILNVAAGAAIIYGSARAMAAADRATLDSMTGLIRGERSPMAPGARPPAAAAAGRAPTPISVAEFRRLQGSADNAAAPGRPTSAPSRPAATPQAAATGDAAARATSPGNAQAPAPNAGGGQRSYPGLPKVRTDQWDSQVTGKKNADAWCPKWTKSIRDGFIGSKNDFIGMGPCGCELAKNSVSNTMPGVFVAEYFCKFDYTWRQNVPDTTSR